MASLNLTAAAIENLAYDPNGPSRQVLWDKKVPGLGVRVTPANGKQFVLSYRRHGRSRLMSLGAVAHFRNVSDARDTAFEYLRQLRREDVDPLIERAKKKAAGSVKEMLQTWLLEHVKKKRSAKSLEDYTFYVEKYLEPEFGNHRPPDVTRPEVRRLHSRISKTGPYAANRCVATLRAAYNWTAKQDNGTLSAGHPNPAQGIEFNPEKAGDEFLRPDELPPMTAAVQLEPDPYVRGYFWLLLLSGARVRAEALCLRWPDVHLDRGEIVLRDTKNGTDLTLKLSGAAIDVLRKLPRVAGSDFVFPARRSDNQTGYMAPPRVAWRAALKRAGITRRVTFKDVRRTAGTSLASAGFTAEQIARQLNHKSNVTAKHYIRIVADIQQQMADELGRVLSPSATVGQEPTPIRRRA